MRKPGTFYEKRVEATSSAKSRSESIYIPELTTGAWHEILLRFMMIKHRAPNPSL